MTTLTNTTLTIKDLPRDEEMDHKAMAAVRGGAGMTYGEAFKMLQDAAAGKCEVVSKTFVCYG